MFTTRKFNTELTEEDIFYPTKEEIEKINWDNITWDWHFEKKAYYVKKDTIEKFEELIEVVVKNRGIVEHVHLCCTADLPSMGISLNQGLIYLYQSLYSRMIKTSKIIQDLSIQGSYIEAKALLRNNFERAVILQYFTNNLDKVLEFIKAKNEGDKKILRKYSIKKITDEIKKDYKTYEILCNFSHPSLYEEDASFFEFSNEAWVSMQAYNSFDHEDFFGIMLWNNNLLIETFDVMLKYLTKNLPNENMDKDIKRVLDTTKKLKLILVKENNKESNK